MELIPFNQIENDKMFIVEINNYDLKTRLIELSDALFQPFEINSDDFYAPILSMKLIQILIFTMKLIIILVPLAIIIWKMHFHP